MKSFRNAPLVKGVSNRIYYYLHHKVLDSKLSADGAIVLLAVDSQNPDSILGWIWADVVDTALVIHYIYVKHAFRRRGVAKMLVQLVKDAEKPPAIMYTHRTNVVPKILKKEGLEWIYNPYLLFTTLPQGWEQ